MTVGKETKSRLRTSTPPCVICVSQAAEEGGETAAEEVAGIVSPKMSVITII